MRDSQIGTINDYYQNKTQLEMESKEMRKLHYPANQDSSIYIEINKESEGLALIKSACGGYYPARDFDLDLFDCEACLNSLIDDMMDNTTIDDDLDYEDEYPYDDDWNDYDDDLYVDDREYNQRLSLWLDTQGYIGAGR